MKGKAIIMSTIITGLMGCAGTGRPAARTATPEAGFITHHVVFKEDGQYAAFPTLSMDPANDALYAVFSVKDEYSHAASKDHRYVTMESRDGGLTWQSVAGIPATARDARPGLFNAGRDVDQIGPGGAFEVPDGALVRIGFDYMKRSSPYLERSEDTGRTWRRTCLDGFENVRLLDYWAYTQLPLRAGATVARAFLVRREDEPVVVSVVLTQDGREAQVVEALRQSNDGPQVLTEENMMHATRSGVLWMLGRVHPEKHSGGEGYSWWHSISTDGGLSWRSQPLDLSVGPTPPSGLVELADGRLVLVYGCRGGRHRRENSGIRAIVSYDEGLTWRTDQVLTLREDGAGFDVGYPRAVQLSDGTIVTIYYYRTTEEAESEDPSTRSIVATRFRLQDTFE